MSLPLTRRIARAALLIAAGAAPVVGAAGAAGAAELPQTPDLGGLTTVEGAGLGKTVDSASQQGTEAAGDTGGKIVGTTLPAASKTVGKAGAETTPAVQKAAGGAAGTAGQVIGGAAGAAPQGGLPTQGLPLG
ncbi:ATP-binding protein [Streptomyces sp. NBC_01591]|uniref:ATP-binding protein n=1 Tax=Streptomyces sp. NBC_01591 TaxID=2975888 RepID=UPI002DD9DFA8|nr:ATP-binding protein [Streptomyces sp. NBC_01591]WSD70678.1 ATP-binding protein [Streptomyces sp. NBC_01591]